MNLHQHSQRNINSNQKNKKVQNKVSPYLKNTRPHFFQNMEHKMNRQNQKVKGNLSAILNLAISQNKSRGRTNSKSNDSLLKTDNKKNNVPVKMCKNQKPPPPTRREKDIREAIEYRYRKSKMRNYVFQQEVKIKRKVKEEFNSTVKIGREKFASIPEDSKSYHSKNNRDDQRSEGSQNMEEFHDLKRLKYFNLREFHFYRDKMNEKSKDSERSSLRSKLRIQTDGIHAESNHINQGSSGYIERVQAWDRSLNRSGLSKIIQTPSHSTKKNKLKSGRQPIQYQSKSTHSIHSVHSQTVDSTKKVKQKNQQIPKLNNLQQHHRKYKM